MSIKDIVRKHEEFRNRCINLIASENVVSNHVKALLTSDLMHRYSLKGYKASNFYRGTRYIDELLAKAEGLACKLFNARYANLKPISGHVAGLSMLMLKTRINDTIMVLDIDSGGYPGYTRGYMPDRLGLKVEYIPYDHYKHEVDYDKAIDAIDTIKPRAVIIAESIVIFPSKIDILSKACKDNRSLLIHDSSHTLGLIAGSAISNPLLDGADVMLGSTHKSFPGPQGGIILSNEPIEGLELIAVDNPHFNRIAALAVAIEEMLKYGKDYAKQVVSNAKALAKALDEQGLEVIGKPRYTDTHQVLLKPFKDYEQFTARLERSNIIVDNGFRLGTAEITRRGMREQEMKYIAELIYKVYAYNAYVKKEIMDLASRFNTIHYC